MSLSSGLYDPLTFAELRSIAWYNPKTDRYMIKANGVDLWVRLEPGERANVQLYGKEHGSLTLLGFGKGDAVRSGSGSGFAARRGAGSGKAIRSGSGLGNADRVGDGDGDAVRSGKGGGDASRSDKGDGWAVRSGKGYGSAYRNGKGEGCAVRSGNGDGDASRYYYGDITFKGSPDYALRSGKGEGTATCNIYSTASPTGCYEEDSQGKRLFVKMVENEETGNDYVAMLGNGYLRIGCQTHTLIHWLKKAEEICDDHEEEDLLDDVLNLVNRLRTQYPYGTEPTASSKN